MGVIADLTRLTGTCHTCGSTFQPTLHQVMSAPIINCEPCRACLACGKTRKAGPKPFGLRICGTCHSLAWQSCWRKQAHTEQPPAFDHEDGVAMYPYRCDLCQFWHVTKMPAEVALPGDYVERRQQLAHYLRQIRFDIDAFRHRTPSPAPVGGLDRPNTTPGEIK